jgi:hypothetical protein
MSTERRQRAALSPAASGSFRHQHAAALHSRVRANPAKLPPDSPQVTAYRVAERRDGSADRSVVCLGRATVSRPELAARPTLNAMTSPKEGQRRLDLQGLELLGCQGKTVGVAGVAALVGRNHLTGK